MSSAVRAILRPTPSQAEQLGELLERYNAGASWLARTADELDLHNVRHVNGAGYRILRERFGLPAGVVRGLVAAVAHRRGDFSPGSPIELEPPNALSFPTLTLARIRTLEERIEVPMVVCALRGPADAQHGLAILAREGDEWTLTCPTLEA